MRMFAFDEPIVVGNVGQAVPNGNGTRRPFRTTTMRAKTSVVLVVGCYARESCA